MPSGALPGNKNGLKFKTTEARAGVFKELIKHLENAFDQDSFEPCDWDTVEYYIKNFPEDFPADEIAAARRRGHKVLEKMLTGIAHGKINGNAAAAIFIVKNKLPRHYRDKTETEHMGRGGGDIVVKVIDDIPING